MATHNSISSRASAQPSLKVPNIPNDLRKPEDPLTLPPGINSDQFQAFIVRAQSICGEENVTIISDSSQLNHEQYIDPSKAHDMHNIVDKAYFVASAVLSPVHVPDIQALMRLCNEFDVPAWPFSIGRKYVLELLFYSRINNVTDLYLAQDTEGQLLECLAVLPSISARI